MTIQVNLTDSLIMRSMTIESLRTETKLKSKPAVIKDRKVNFFGHINLTSIGLSNLIQEDRANVTRSRGKPKRRWIYDIKNWIVLVS